MDFCNKFKKHEIGFIKNFIQNKENHVFQCKVRINHIFPEYNRIDHDQEEKYGAVTELSIPVTDANNDNNKTIVDHKVDKKVSGPNKNNNGNYNIYLKIQKFEE